MNYRKTRRAVLKPEQIPEAAKQSAISLVAFHRTLTAVYKSKATTIPVEIAGQTYTITIEEGVTKS